MTATPADASVYGREAAALALILVLLLAPGRILHAIEALGGPAPVVTEGANPSDKPVHRFLRVEISPDAGFIASVEGDSPIGGYYPPLRELLIRRVRDAGIVRVALPCGHVPQCWPDSPAWTPDGKHLTFALRTPGSHARSLYTVTSDGSSLKKLLEFGGTINDLRYGADGRLAMLATAEATKETGATEAGTPRSGDLDAAPPEQRIAIVKNGALQWVSPPELYVYEYDWRPAGKGFVGTASPGNGDNNWWTALLYAFSEGGTAPRLIYEPRSPRQQLASPTVSRDGRTLAFIAGLMSDFGSTGGDVFTVPIDGGTAMNLTPGMAASATALSWRCDGRLIAKLLTGDRTEFADLGSGVREENQEILWGGMDSIASRSERIQQACPSGLMAVEHESFTEPPEIEVGTMGRWRNLTAENAGEHLAAQVRSLWWESDGFKG